MNSEELRLRSFDTWTGCDQIRLRILSAGGFYATGNSYEVKCNWCNCKFNYLESNESIEQLHVRASPNCNFILNRNQCGNIPISIASTEIMRPQDYRGSVNVNGEGNDAKEHPTLDLLIEKDRLATFVNWPNPNITPQALAKAGFFYRNRSDQVECAWCKGVIAQWEKHDNAFDEHRRFFPECPRVQLGPLIEIANDGIRDLGIQHITSPKNPKYTSLQARLRTYSNWPIPNIQRPEDLAQAGLYYQKVDDQVRCFHCNMGLRSWEKEDDPWFEHAKWYPMCEFVRLVKGANYIQDVQELTRNVHTSNTPIVPISIEEAMLTEHVKIALDMGIDNNILRIKIQQKISETGQPYETIDDLLKAVFDEPEGINTDFENRPHSSSGSCHTNPVINELNLNDLPRNYSNAAHVLKDACSSAENDIQTINNNKSFDNVHAAPVNINQIENNLPLSDTNGKLSSDRKYLEEENRKLKDARLCKVCLDEEVGVVYLPCGHLVTCVQCAPGVNQCPMCRTKIKGFVRTYLS